MKKSVNLKWFALVYVATMVAVVLLSFVFSMALGIKLPGSVILFLPSLLATLHVGKMYFEDFREVPHAKEAWAAARRMTLVEMIITFPIAVGLAAITLGGRKDFDWGPFMLTLMMLAVFAGFAYGVFLVAKRFMFVAAAKAELHRQENMLAR